MRRLLLSTTVALLTLGIPLAAPGGGAYAQGEAALTAPTVSFPDADFVIKAGQSNTEEVVLGALARERATNPDIKEFGHHMVADHLKAGKELLAIAAKKGIPLPKKAVEQIVRTERAILAARSGKQFDLEYIKQQVAGHEVALTLFRFAAENASDPAIREYARKFLPVIQEHLKEAKALLQQLTATSAQAE